MADVATHALVFEEIERVVADRVPPGDVIYMELGNWLTDVSQFRDPFATIGAKTTVWAQVLEYPELLVSALGLAENLDELLGTPEPGRRFGALSQYFEQLCLAATIERFTRAGLAEAEIMRVFSGSTTAGPASSPRRFTQYYPHEHLDFPPWPFGSPVGDRRPAAERLTLFQLERQLEYVAEGLTIVEDQWASARAAGDARGLHDALAAYGHLSHAIEDFFFHSNFVEIAHYHRLRARYDAEFTRPGTGSGQRRVAPEFWDWFAAHALDDEVGAMLPRDARRFLRRLCAPVPGPDRRSLSRDTSQPGFLRVYTGGFGATDVFHTFADALAGVGAALPPLTGPGGVERPVTLVLPEYLFDPQRRRSLTRGGELASAIAAHERQVSDRVEEPIVDALVATGRLRPASGEAIKAAYAIDRRIHDRHVLSVGGFLLRLAAVVEVESARSARVAADLDAATDVTRRVLDRRTDNRVSAEVVGSHTLMAKDSDAKVPFRHDAVALAMFVASYVADLMATTVSRGPRHVDWLHLLHHFLDHPSAGLRGWEWEVLARTRVAGEGPPPPVSQPPPSPPLLARVGRLRDRPRPRSLTSDDVAARRRDQARLTLETTYRDLEAPAERAWRRLRPPPIAVP